MEKMFKLTAAQIKSLKIGMGGCFASDMITVGGKRVNFMYREQPDFKEDSGWRFFSGHESDEYLDNPKNTEIYDVNTICNYDADIIPFLDAPVGTAFERDNKIGKFVRIKPCKR